MYYYFWEALFFGIIMPANTRPITKKNCEFLGGAGHVAKKNR